MAYDVDAIISDVKIRAKDLSLSSSLITTFIQATQDEVLSRSRYPFMEVVADPATLSINDTSYTPPSAVDTVLFLSLKDATQTASWEPEYLPYAQFYEWYERPEDATASAPQYYTIFGGLILWPAPLDKAYELKLRYLKKSTALASGSSVPDIPEAYKEILTRGALAGVEEYRENFDIGGVHRRKVEELAEDMLGRSMTRQLVKPHKARFGGRPNDSAF